MKINKINIRLGQHRIHIYAADDSSPRIASLLESGRINEIDIELDETEEHASILGRAVFLGEIVEFDHQVVTSKKIEALKMSVHELDDISVRTENAIQSIGIEQIWQLVTIPEATLLKQRRFNKSIVREVKQILHHLDLELGMDIEPYKPFLS